MAEKSLKKIKGREKLIFGLIIAAVVVAGIAALLARKAEVKLPAVSPGIPPAPEGVPTPTEGVPAGPVKCPADYCGALVWGAGPCPAATDKAAKWSELGCPMNRNPARPECDEYIYNEQTCYDYPDTAASAEECEAKKTSYRLVCGVR